MESTYQIWVGLRTKHRHYLARSPKTSLTNNMDASRFLLILVHRQTWLKSTPLPLAEIPLGVESCRSLSVGVKLLAQKVVRDRQHLKVELVCPIGAKTDWFLVEKDVTIESPVSCLGVESKSKFAYF